jgi:hypothetical protein
MIKTIFLKRWAFRQIKSPRKTLTSRFLQRGLKIEVIMVLPPIYFNSPVELFLSLETFPRLLRSVRLSGADTL